MMGRRIQMRQLTQIIALVVLGIFWGASHEASAAGNEARCNALGANCICSEPMNTNSYPLQAGGFTEQWNPADTTGSDKQCNGADEVGAGALISGTSLAGSGVNSGEAITRLPVGHTNTWVFKNTNPDVGTFLGHHDNVGSPTARRAIRFYRYYSDDWTSHGGCNSNKVAQFGTSFPQSPVFTSEAGPWSWSVGPQGGDGWNQTIDCCSSGGPGNAGTVPSPSEMRGKWWRIEIVIHNAASGGAPTTFQAWVKNVTDNGAEQLVMDTSQTNAQWTSTMATNLHRTSTMNFMGIDNFRSSNAATCFGFTAHSHFLYAAWSTDAGQRIGAASEIEGGGGDTTPPAPPTNLRLSLLSVEE